MDIDNLITIQECALMLGVSRSTLTRWRQKPDFPKPLHLKSIRICFLRQDIFEWMSKKMQQEKAKAEKFLQHGYNYYRIQEETAINEEKN